jgi:asparagine synthetase B (glutamine-hydrolysing)
MFTSKSGDTSMQTLSSFRLFSRFRCFSTHVLSNLPEYGAKSISYFSSQQMFSDQPVVTIAMSGGVDSSVVASLLAKAVQIIPYLQFYGIDWVKVQGL